MESEKLGKAYAFLCCDAGLDEIQTELSAISSNPQARIPEELDLRPYLLKERIQKIPVGFRHVSEKFVEYGIDRVIEANWPGATNEEAAVLLNDILGYVSNSTLYSEAESSSFLGEIGYVKFGEAYFLRNEREIPLKKIEVEIDGKPYYF